MASPPTHPRHPEHPVLSRVSMGALVAALLLLAIGCDGSERPTPTAPIVSVSSGEAPKAVPTAGPLILQVGISLPLSGSAASRAGVAARRFLELAIDEINARGGVAVAGQTYRLSPVLVDDRFTAPAARLAAERLVRQEEVRFVLGTTSVATPEVQAITEPNGVLLLSQGAPERSLGPAFPYTFQLGPPHRRMRLAALFDAFATEYPWVKRVLLVQAADGGETLGDVESAARGSGLTVVGREVVPPDLRDFTALDRRVVRLAPDALYLDANMGPLFLALLRTLAQLPHHLAKNEFSASFHAQDEPYNIGVQALGSRNAM